MSEEVIQVGIAFPAKEEDRNSLRTKYQVPLPIIVPNSTDTPCSECGMLLSVGPRLTQKIQETGMILVCPFCAVRKGYYFLDYTVTSLGNPDSRLEERDEQKEQRAQKETG